MIEFIWHRNNRAPRLVPVREPNSPLMFMVDFRKVIDAEGNMWAYHLGGKILWAWLGQFLNPLERSDSKNSRFNKWEMSLNK